VRFGRLEMPSMEGAAVGGTRVSAGGHPARGDVARAVPVIATTCSSGTPSNCERVAALTGPSISAPSNVVRTAFEAGFAISAPGVSSGARRGADRRRFKGSAAPLIPPKRDPEEVR